MKNITHGNYSDIKTYVLTCMSLFFTAFTFSLLYHVMFPNLKCVRIKCIVNEMLYYSYIIT